MNAQEANVFLTKTALLDGRFKREPEERADMAEEWAAVLADVPLRAAVWAIRRHYRRETRGITPADVRTLVDEWAEDHAPTLTEIEQRRERDQWLREHHLDPTEWDRLIAAGNQPADILAARGISIEGITA